MANLVLSYPVVNNTLMAAFMEVSKGAGYDDVAILALLAIGGASYLSHGRFWDKPDPYHYKWFERPQEGAMGDLKSKQETRNIAQKLEETQRDLVIFWGSQSGTAEGFAHRLARDCHRRFRLEAFVADLSDYDHESITLIPETKFAIFIMSTYGEGDPSDNSAEFWTWLREASAVPTGQSLKQLRYMAFGLGNTNYKYYNKIIDVVVEKLNILGASVMMPVGKANDANGSTEEDFVDWKDQVFGIFRASLGLTEREPEYEPTLKVVQDESMDQIDLYKGEPVLQRHAKKTAEATSVAAALPIKESRELFNNPTGGRSCVHMELDLSATPHIKYKTGDHVAIWPINPDIEVQRLLRVLDWESRQKTPLTILSLDPANTKVKIPTPTNALALFQHYLEICASVSRETVLALAQFAQTPEAKSMLFAIGKDKDIYHKFLSANYMTLGRLLEHTKSDWSSLPLSFVIETLSPMSPRYYSISSSSIVSPHFAALTAVVSSTPLPSDPTQTIPGLATSYLSALTNSSTSVAADPPRLTYPFIESGTRLHAHIRKSTFKLPANPATPIILVAAGTGLAPFRGFLQERARLHEMGREVGPTILFFGCRNPEEDYLYKAEIEEFCNSSLKNKLTIVTAFSRIPGSKKVYVQDRVAEHAECVIDLVLNDNAVFYICGSANMARDVTKRLGDCLKTRNSWSDEELKGWSEKQKKYHRWQEDVWG